MSALKINHAAVWVAIVIAHALGFLWYGFLFQEAWMDAAGLTMADIEAAPAGAGHWISNTIATILPIYLLAWMFVKMDIRSGVQGAIIGLLISFCFVLCTMITTGMFEGEPYGLAWINGGSTMLVITVAGFILGAWTKTSSAD
ncbi:DUF1761 domain-containing protein [Portibacter marinus]|uniref:DUF1761 domain-containing protein n=1 Tax=Portibacter marinus TaxID=2898660 RepID=UPI001F3B6E7E|nr:DUF1761 domain-containing protein [Portibacter marinus]